MALTHLAQRIFGTPHLIAPGKLEVIVQQLGPRLGIDVRAGDGAEIGPEAEPKRARRGPAIEGRPAAQDDLQVALVQIVGTLVNRASGLDALSGISGYEVISQEIERLAADPSIDGILLEVDSFGGEAAGCFDLADRIHAARQQKPVYGVANQYAMSAGYALLSQCERVFVPQSGEVGSVGVVVTHMDVSQAAEQEGVRVTHVHAGAHKVDLSPFRALSEEARGRLEADVHQLYDQFVAVVARGGRADEEAARATEAGTFIGQKAVDAGLADEVGDKAAALDALFAAVEDRRMDEKARARAAALEVENKQLRQEIEALKKAAAEHQAREDAAYLEHLATRSAELQAPIDAAKLERVKAHMAAGRRDFARELGDELLEAAEARAQRPFQSVPAAPKAENDHQRAVVRGRARLLKRQGFKVELSEDGTRIVKAIPPQAKA